MDKKKTLLVGRFQCGPIFLENFTKIDPTREQRFCRVVEKKRNKEINKTKMLLKNLNGIQTI